MHDRILFVCMDNVCRSPLSEGILRKTAKESGLELFIDSAASGAFQVGDAPDPRAVVAARLQGIDISDQKGRAFRPADFQAFSLIVAMDRTVLSQIEAQRPVPSEDGSSVEEEAETALITDFSADPKIAAMKDVPDPYFTGQFEPVIDILTSSIEGLVARLR